MLIEVNKSGNSYSVTPDITPPAASVNGLTTTFALFSPDECFFVAFKGDGSNITSASELDQTKVLITKGSDDSYLYVDSSIQNVDWTNNWSANGAQVDSYTVTYANGILTLTGNNDTITFTFTQQSQEEPEMVCLAALITGGTPT